MASIRKRGSNSYLIVVSRGYDYEGNRLKSVQKTVKPPKEYTPKQAEKWVKEQAILFEREVQHTCKIAELRKEDKIAEGAIKRIQRTCESNRIDQENQYTNNKNRRRNRSRQR